MPHLLHEAAKANAKDLIEALIKEGTALDDYDEVRLEMRKRERERERKRERERECVCVCVCQKRKVLHIPLHSSDLI